MTFLIDAVHCLISSDEQENHESRTLNTELADYLASKSEMTIVTTNARGDRGQKIRELLADYSFEYHSMENMTPKTDPEYRDHLLLYYGLVEEECIYLDHAQENIDAAQELGIQGELFVDTAQAIEFLQDNISK